MRVVQLTLTLGGVRIFAAYWQCESSRIDVGRETTKIMERTRAGMRELT